jgi:hypothetical protein
VDDHPSSEDFAAYLSGTLDPEARDRFEAHLADCKRCRRELVLARRHLRSRRTARRVAWVAPIAAAAVVGIVLVTSRPSSVKEERTRARPTMSAGNAGRSIHVVSPRDSATIAEGPLSFVWNRAANGALYRVTVTDLLGRVIWSGETRDTSVVAPSNAALAQAGDVLWYVDAVTGEGATVTSGLQRLKIKP